MRRARSRDTRKASEAPKTAAMYGRVSSDEQAGNASTRGQLEEAKRFCDLRGLELVGSYFDEAKSGKSVAGRDQLQLMLEDARAGKFGHLVVWKLTRLSRNLLDTLTIIEDLDIMGIHFHSVTEPDFDTSTASGRMFLRIIASLAEYEREVIAENVAMGLRQRASEGAWIGGEMLGYRVPVEGVDPPDVKKAGRLIVVPEEAETVRRIFALFAEGKGLKATCNRINKEGYRTKRGGFFAAPQIGPILDNPVYQGHVRVTMRGAHAEEEREFGVENAHEAIIDEELWEKVRFLRALKSERPTRAHERGFPLTGILRCPECGAGMTMSRTTATRKDGSKHITERYSCGRWKNQGTTACHSNGVVAGTMEKAVFARLRKVVTHPTLLRDVIRRVNERQESEVRPLQRRLAEIERERRKQDALQKKYFRDFGKDDLEAGLLREKLAEIEEQMAAFDQEEAEVRAKLRSCEATEPVPVEAVRTILEDFVAQLRRASTDQQGTLLKALVREITFEQGKGVKSISLHLQDDVARVLGLPTASLPGPVTLTV